MRRFKRNAWWLMLVAAAAVTLPTVATGDATENGSRTGASFTAFVPGVNEAGELDGHLGYKSADVHQVENGRRVMLTVWADVPNLSGRTVRHEGFLYKIRLASGEMVRTRDSSIVVTGDGRAVMRGAFVKPRDEEGDED